MYSDLKQVFMEVWDVHDTVEHTRCQNGNTCDEEDYLPNSVAH